MGGRGIVMLLIIVIIILIIFWPRLEELCYRLMLHFRVNIAPIENEQEDNNEKS